MRIGLEDGPWALIPEGIFFSKYPLPSAEDVACGDVWVLGIRRRNLLETFSNFYHSLHMRSHDTSTSFVNFGLRLHFL